MKVLLDEHVPHRLRREIVGHEVMTVQYVQLSGLRNGALLARAASLGFDALITTDRDMEHEHNLATLPIAIVLLRARTNAIGALRPLVPELLRALSTLQPRTLVKVGDRP